MYDAKHPRQHKIVTMASEVWNWPLPQTHTSERDCHYHLTHSLTHTWPPGKRPKKKQERTLISIKPTLLNARNHSKQTFHFGNLSTFCFALKCVLLCVLRETALDFPQKPPPSALAFCKQSFIKDVDSIFFQYVYITKEYEKD